MQILKYIPPLQTQSSLDSLGDEVDVQDSAAQEETDSIGKTSPPGSPFKKQDSFSFKKQGSVRSNKSVDINVPGTVNENFIKTEGENLQSSQPRKTVSRTGSLISNASQGETNEFGLGRILLTFTYNNSRQRFEVVVHKIV